VARGGEEQRVAVGRCLGDAGGADSAARAGAVFDDDRLLQCRRHLAAESPRQNLARAAGRERHHDARDLAARLAERFRGARHARGGNEQRATAKNRDSPYFLSALARSSAFSRHIGQARL